jgi:hypothetical protein
MQVKLEDDNECHSNKRMKSKCNWFRVWDLPMHSEFISFIRILNSHAEENFWNSLLFTQVIMKLVIPWKDGITFTVCLDHHLATCEDL